MGTRSGDVSVAVAGWRHRQPAHGHTRTQHQESAARSHRAVVAAYAGDSARVPESPPSQGLAFLFPGQNESKPLSRDAVGLAICNMAPRAGIDKKVPRISCDTRFATHMLELGTDLSACRYCWDAAPSRARHAPRILTEALVVDNRT